MVKTQNGTVECEKARLGAEGDVKALVAEMLIQHNLLSPQMWRAFHKDLQGIAEKYYPHYRKQLNGWFKGTKPFVSI